MKLTSTDLCKIKDFARTELGSLGEGRIKLRDSVVSIDSNDALALAYYQGVTRFLVSAGVLTNDKIPQFELYYPNSEAAVED